jgi:hypothetical protein
MVLLIENNMENKMSKKLTNLLSKFGLEPDALSWDYSKLWTDAKCDEGCPECGCDAEITQDGKSDCSECGHKEVLPCSVCPLSDLQLCDWNEETRCSPFPKTNQTWSDK